jgi:hypothetical protein
MLIALAAAITQTIVMLLPLAVPASALGAEPPLTRREHRWTLTCRALVSGLVGVLLAAYHQPLAATGVMLMWIGVEREIHLRRRQRHLRRRGLETP